MIYSAFHLLAEQLQAYIKSEQSSSGSDVVLGNISAVDSGSGVAADLQKKIILSLVNIEEEATMKNRQHFSRFNQGVAYQNPPVYLNLYMLVTAYNDDYKDALISLSDVIHFFQSRSGFSLKDSPLEKTTEDGGIEELEIFVDLYSLTFEQLNHLWGSLGGKQWPAALYKVRLVRISDNKINGLGTVIEQVIRRDAIIIG